MKKGKNRTKSNGEGTVYQNPNGTWTGQYTVPGGNRHSKTFETQKLARVWVTEKTHEIDTGNHVDPSMISLNIWWDKWIEAYCKRSVSEATMVSYAFSKKRLPNDLLTKAISKITAVDIQDVLNKLDDAGSSTRTIEITRTHLNMCFERALTEKKTKANPVSNTVLPDDDSKESIPLTEVEVETLVGYCMQPPSSRTNGKLNLHDVRRQVYKDALLLIIRTGVRRSEALDVEWSDWNENTLHIRGTKTRESDRLLPITADVIEMLKRRFSSRSSQFIFTSASGTQLDGRNLLRHLQEFNGHKVHDLRHTFCTRAAQAGVNPKVLQTITGHKKIETLLQIYTHVNDDDRAAAAEMIAAYCKSTAN